MTYRPGQTVWVDNRWPLKTDAVFIDGVVELVGNATSVTKEGDALVIAVVPGPVRETVKHGKWGHSESRKDSRGTALMLLLPQGTYGWIKTDGNYPQVTSE